MTLNGYKLNVITCSCTRGDTNERKEGAGALGVAPDQWAPPSAANAHHGLSLSATLAFFECPSPQLPLITGALPSDFGILFLIYETYL